MNRVVSMLFLGALLKKKTPMCDLRVWVRRKEETGMNPFCSHPQRTLIGRFSQECRPSKSG